MPNFDGTGPLGQGAMTGGGRGYCAIPLNSANLKPRNGRGFYGRGNGRGFRNCFNASGLPGWTRAQRGMQAFGRMISKDDELAMLKNQADYFKEELDAINSRVQELESQKGDC
jgi:hypothetical protein